MVKQLKGNFRNTLRVINDKDGNILTDIKATKERWTKYVKDFFTDAIVYKRETLDRLRGRKVANETEDGITLEEIVKAIKKLKNNKSIGIDGIPVELIKVGGTNIAKRKYIKYV